MIRRLYDGHEYYERGASLLLFHATRDNFPEKH